MGIFGDSKASEKNPANIQEAARQWKLHLIGEQRKIERQIRAIEQEEMKTKRLVKEAAKRGDMESARILCRELVHAKKAKERFYISKVQINSTVLALQHQMASMRIGQAIQKSTEVLTAMNQLVRMPEVAQTMRQLGMEMMKAGLIDETINDAMESLDEPNAEAEADAEVDKVLTEVVRGTLDKVASPVAAAQAEPASEAPASEAPADDSAIRARLDALRA